MVLSFSLFDKRLFAPEESAEEGGSAGGGDFVPIADDSQAMSDLASVIEKVEADHAPDDSDTGAEEPKQETEPEDEQSGDDNSADDVSESEPEINTDLLEAAKGYGLSAEEVAGFDSVESLDLAMQLYDRQTSQTGRQIAEQQQQQQLQYQQQEQQQAEQAQQQQSQYQQQAQQERQVQQKQPPPPSGYEDIEEKLKDAGYEDEAILSAFRKQANENHQLKNGFKELVTYLQGEKQRGVNEQQFQAQQQQQLDDQQFYEHVDGLKKPGLFGSSTSVTDSQQANVSKLYDELLTLRAGMANSGRDSFMSKGLVDRAYRLSHPGEIQKESRSTYRDKVAKQSRRRMGSGQTTKSRKNVPWDGEPEKNPVLIDAWNEFQDENGRKP